MSINSNQLVPAVKFLFFSVLGVVTFFVPVEIGDRSTILIDHLVTLITSRAPAYGIVYAFVLILWGVVAPFRNGSWKSSIPCILATGIPITLLQMLVIWLQRTLLSIPLAYGVGRLFGVT